MAESLIHLENVLRSKQEKLSSQEANFLMTWKEKTLQQLTVGAVAGGAIAWSGKVLGSLARAGKVRGQTPISLVYSFDQLVTWIKTVSFGALCIGHALTATIQIICDFVVLIG